MAATIGSVVARHFGKHSRTGTINLGVYATGGVTVTTGALGLARLEWVQVSPAGGYVFEYDYTNSKVKAYWQTDPGAVGGANIALIEVADTTDLTAVVTRFLAVGE